MGLNISHIRRPRRVCVWSFVRGLCALTEHRAGHQRGQPRHVAEGRGVQGVDARQLGDAARAGQRADVVHPPEDQLAVDGVGVVERPRGRVAKLLPEDAVKKTTNGR